MSEYETIGTGRKPRLIGRIIDADGNEAEGAICFGWQHPPKKIGEKIWIAQDVWDPN